MPFGETLLAFTLTSVLVEITPGPNMAWLAILTLGDGRRAGYAAVAGVALGLALVGAVAALGLAAIVAASTLAYQGLRWGGVAFPLWLAWQGWHDEKPASDRPDPDGRLWLCFRRGLVTNLLNPKAAMFYLAVLPTFAGPDGLRPAETLTLSAIYVGVATTIHAGIVTLAGSLRVWLTDADRQRLTRRVLSLLLAGVALWFAWKSAWARRVISLSQPAPI